MIKINLAAKKQSSLVGGANDHSAAVLLARFGVSGSNIESLKGLPLRRFIIPLAMYLIASQFSETYKKQLLDEVDAVIGNEKVKISRLETEASKLKDYERLKLGLEGDEALIRNKMMIINSLLKERAVKLRLLIELSKATPNDVWLTSVQESNDLITIKGRTENFNSLPDYLSNLSAVQFMTNVTLKNSMKTDTSKSDSVSKGNGAQMVSADEPKNYVEFEIEATERLN